MENPVTTVWNVVSQLAARAADGLQALGATVGVKQNTEALVRADLAAAKTAQNAYQAAKGARLSAVATQDGADQDGRVFIRTARDVFKKTLGAHYSQAWNEVGFVNHSLGIPRTLSGRAALLDAMGDYLAAHPAMEVAALDVSTGHAQDVYQALADAMQAVAQAEVLQETRRNARDAAVATLCTRLRNLVKELSGLLGPDDPRWKQFGFNEPGDSSVPLPPEGLLLSAGVAQQLQAEWKWTSGAARYHVYQLVVGRDTDYVYVKTTSDTQANLNHYASGAHVRVRLTALNSSGESLPCEPVEAVVP